MKYYNYIKQLVSKIPHQVRIELFLAVMIGVGFATLVTGLFLLMGAE